MKKMINQIFTLTLMVALFASCNKDENKDYYEGGTAPVLKATVSTPQILDILLKNSQAVVFSWTNPNYKFTTGISSQDVSYILQMDTTGNNFTGKKIQEKAISKDLSTTLTIGELNTYLLTMGVLEDLPHNIEFRIKSTLANGSVPLYSNVIKLVFQPYLDVVYPVPAKLFITGSATPAGWQCGCGEPDLISQKFTKVSSSKFELTVALSANNSYLLLPVYGSWSAKYGGTGASNNSNNVNGDGFKPNGSDLKAPGSTGTYKITVDFKTGTFSVQ